MQPWQVGIVVTVFLFLAGHLGAAIWFASRMNEQVKGIVTDVNQLTDEVRALIKQETRMSVLEQRMLALEKAIEGRKG